MSNTNGINVSRRIATKNNIGEELRNVRTQGTAPFLQMAVVVDVIYDPGILTTEEKQELVSTVANPQFISQMPKNSIIARVVSNSQDVGDSRPRILYPFFQSHFNLPLKAGEQVFLIYPDPQTDGNELGYWMTRIPESHSVEDLNFTHGDRRYDQTLSADNRPTSQRGEASSQQQSIPGFPNGGGTPESISLFIDSARDRPYEAIFQNAKANKQTTYEPVARFVKRPADFALVGSNNVRIVLGEDRTGPATRTTGNNNTTSDKIGKAGAIDLVAGAGSTRTMPESQDDDPLTRDPTKRPTAPRVIENTRRFKEVDKAPFKNQKRDNPAEGDPDFKRDLSRLYIAMNTAGDRNFEIKLKGANGIFPEVDEKVFDSLKAGLADLPDTDDKAQPFIVAKSEQIRIIATKKDQESGGPAENGSIRLIKEGTVSDKDLALFVLDKEGNIFQLAKNYQLLTHEDGKVFIRCKNDSQEESDPAVLYSKLKNTLDNIIDAIGQLTDKVSQQFQSLGTVGFSVPNATTPFGPVPAIVAAKAQCASAVTQLNAFKATIEQMKSSSADNAKIKEIKSKWIFLNKENQ